MIEIAESRNHSHFTKENPATQHRRLRIRITALHHLESSTCTILLYGNMFTKYRFFFWWFFRGFFCFFVFFLLFPEKDEAANFKFGHWCLRLSVLWSHHSFFLKSYLNLFICHCPLFYAQITRSLGMRRIFQLNVWLMPNRVCCGLKI